MFEYSDEYFMRHALKEAQNAYDKDEVPVGAVIVINNKIIARGYNQVELLNDPTAHAEILAITSACNYLGAKYLTNAILYVTIEPCLMCCGAMYWSKLTRIVYGAITAEQTEKKKKIRNDRFLAIPEEGKILSEIDSIEDLPDEIMDELEQFFKNYNEIEGKIFTPLKRLNAKEAMKLLKENKNG